MRDAIDFNPETKSLFHGNNVEASPKHTEPVFKWAKTIDLRINMRVIEFDAILPQTKTIDLDGVCMLAITQLYPMANLAANLWTAAHRRCVKLSEFALEFCFISFNGGLYQ